MPGQEIDVRIGDMDGPEALPRSNGELVFAEPWESRAFGLAVTLHEAGVFEWEAFRSRLIARIADWEAAHEPGECYSYYRCWLEALQSLVTDLDLVDAAVLDQRAGELACRPAGHDHSH